MKRFMYAICYEIRGQFGEIGKGSTSGFFSLDSPAAWSLKFDEIRERTNEIARQSSPQAVGAAITNISLTEWRDD